MSELDLAAIKAHDYRRDRNGAATYRQSDLAAVDVPALVAEVERLRVELDKANESILTLAERLDYQGGGNE